MSTNNEIVSIVEDELDITNLFQDALRKTVYGVSVISFGDCNPIIWMFTFKTRSITPIPNEYYF
jgi:hypothetical protein